MARRASSGEAPPPPSIGGLACIIAGAIFSSCCQRNRRIVWAHWNPMSRIKGTLLVENSVREEKITLEALREHERRTRRSEVQ